MAIQWYPGHMYKAGQEMKKILPQVDMIIEVLDARIPFSSANPMLAALRDDKPTLKIFNKMDLADPQRLEDWQHYLEQEQGVKTLAVNAQDISHRPAILAMCRQLVPGKAAGVQKIQAMIMGIPNVGKSTLINMLAQRRIAKTGNEPAVTKMQQRIKLDDSIVLMDTPGVLWPNLENQHSAYRLAVTGAIKETAFENEDIALYALNYLMQHYPAQLQTRFKLAALPDNSQQLLEQMAAGRGCLRSGGRVDAERISKILLTELRAGELGGLTLETPDMMQQELAEVDRIRAEKAEKKAQRKARR